MAAKEVRKRSVLSFTSSWQPKMACSMASTGFQGSATAPPIVRLSALNAAIAACNGSSTADNLETRCAVMAALPTTLQMSHKPPMTSRRCDCTNCSRRSSGHVS